jgi:hypothetical protein
MQMFVRLTDLFLIYSQQFSPRFEVEEVREVEEVVVVG